MSRTITHKFVILNIVHTDLLNKINGPLPTRRKKSFKKNTRLSIFYESMSDDYRYIELAHQAVLYECTSSCIQDL